MKRTYGVEIWRLMNQLLRNQKKTYKLPNLTELETRVLYSVHRHKAHHDYGINIRELKTRLNVSSPTISQVINDLEERDIVKRVKDLHDGRITRVEVSKTGEEALRKAMEILEMQFVKLSDYLGEEKSNQLIEILNDMITFFTQEEQNERTKKA